MVTAAEPGSHYSGLSLSLAVFLQCDLGQVPYPSVPSSVKGHNNNTPHIGLV